MLSGEREQRVIDAVVGEDHQRPFRAQPLRQDPGSRRADLPQRGGIGDGPPWRIGAGTVSEENPLRRLPRPMLQPVADASCALTQWRRRLQDDAAVRAAFGRDRGFREQRFGSVSSASRSWRHRFPPPPSFGAGGLLYATIARPGNVSSHAARRLPCREFFRLKNKQPLRLLARSITCAISQYTC